MQLAFHAQQFFPVAFHHLGHGDTGPARHHLGDFLVGDLVAQQHGLPGFGFLGHGQLFFQLRHTAVLQLRHARQVAGPAGGFQVQLGLLQVTLDLGRALYRGLLRLPDLLQVRELPLHLVDFTVQQFDLLASRRIGILFHRLPLYLKLYQAALQLVHGLRLGVDLHANPAGGLIHQVDGLVRQLPIGDVALRQLGRGDDGTVGYIHPVVHLIALLETAQDGDGVFLVGLVHQHFLEAPLQGRILFHVLAILIERGGAHAVQFTAGQGGLEHIARIHGALGLAGAHHGVQFIYKQDDPALLLGELVEHRFQALLEIAPELGAGQQGAQVQRQDALVLEPLGHLAIDHPLGQALDDRGLAHSGLTDQDGVVLGPPLQYLDGAPDLVVAANDRIQLALLRPLGQVYGVLVQGLAGLFGFGVVNGLATAHLFDRGLQGNGSHAAVLEQLSRPGLAFQHRQQHQLAGDIGVAALLGQLVRHIEDLAQFTGQVDFPPRAADLGQRLQRRFQAGCQSRHVCACLLQQRTGGASFLVKQGAQQVQRLDKIVVLAQCERLRVG